MHEFSLINDLMRKIDEIAREQEGRRIAGVTVWLGALSHISPEHFREHYEHAVAGRPFSGARLEIERSIDEDDPHAQDILLKSVEVEE